MSLNAFLSLLAGLVAGDVIRLWSVDARSGDRTELFVVPDTLTERYAEVDDLDESYDPFGLSLTLGTAAPDKMANEPDWSLELDARGERFELHASEDVAETVLHDVARVLPDICFRRSETRRVGVGQLLITGRVEPREG
jgi:hypothetical protein